MHVHKLCAALVAFVASPPQLLAHQIDTSQAEAGCTQYLGNTGVLVATEKNKIIFDALFRDSYGRFTLVPARIEEELMQGLPPYDNVSAVFVTHSHGDHFSAEPTVEYLRSHRDVALFGSQQTIDAIKLVEADDQILNRLTAFELAPGEGVEQIAFDGLSIDVIAVPHEGGEQMADIQNLAYRVSLTPGMTVLHLGDSTADYDFFEKYAGFLKNKPIAYAFAPYWFVAAEQGNRILHEFFRIEKILAAHLPEAAAAQKAEFEEELKAQVLTIPGEVIVIGAASPDHCTRAH